jgi:hypothetical protein
MSIHDNGGRSTSKVIVTPPVEDKTSGTTECPMFNFAAGVLSVGAKMQRLNKALKSNRDRGITHQSLVKRMSELISLR